MPRLSRTGASATARATSTPAFRLAYEERLAREQARYTRQGGLRPAALGLAMAAAFASSPLVLQANPNGGVAVHGAATMVSNGNQLLVTTANGAGTSHSVINWQSFSIPAGSSTSFQQPNAASTAINRVVTTNPSALFGNLSSNGKLVLVNPAGITVGAGAVVDTAGFTAAAMRMSEADARAGRLRFNADGIASSLSIQGNIIARGGDVVLIAPNAEVAKGAVVESQGGATMLVAGQQVEITGRGLEGIQLQVRAPGDQAVNLGTLRGSAVGIFASTLRHSGLIQATGVGVEGGRVVLRANDVADVSGRIEARRLLNAVEQGGSVSVNAGIAVLSGVVDARSTASGGVGGDVAVQAASIIQTGSLDVSGVLAGGQLVLKATRSLLQTSDARLQADASAGTAGAITLQAGADEGVVVSSAQVSASGAGEQGTGGTVQVLGRSISLQAAEIRADGDANAGSVLVGGDRQGQNSNLPNSSHLFINTSSQLSATSRRRGNGGTVVLWSDGDTRFFGTIAARGAGNGGNGGSVEVSGKEGVQFGGLVEAAGGPGGANGNLLLDPKNITVASSAGGLGVLELADPNQEFGTLGSFGSLVVTLDSARVLVTDPTDNAGGANAGAIYVFNKSTGALQTALTGSHANDKIGSSCITVQAFGCNNLPGATLLFQSSTWNGGVGAWTFINPAAATLSSGVVSASNSLVGTVAGDMTGSSLGAYNTGAATGVVVMLPNYGNKLGAVFTLDTVNGVQGTLSTANALMGSTTGDRIGSDGYMAVSSTQWILKSSLWSNGTLASAGALTAFNPAAVAAGTLSSANSLVGANAGDAVGSSSGSVYLSGNASVNSFSGNLVVQTPSWGGGLGAFTVKGIGSLTGTVDAASSLVGNAAGDGAAFMVLGCDGGFCNPAYSQSNYGSFLLLNTSASGNGSLTRLDPAAPTLGAISSRTSLVGSTAGDFSGASLTTNVAGTSSLMLQLPNWKNGTIAQAGAITFTGSMNVAKGVVSDANSIVGTTTGDLSGASLRYFGDLEALESGKLLLLAPNYGGGTSAGKGAVALIDLPSATLATTVKGLLAPGMASALVLTGSAAGDHVGSGGVDVTQAGYWMIRSPQWSNGGTPANALGAVTFFEPSNSATFATGTVSGGSNSWVGQNPGDQLGNNAQMVIFGNDNGLLLNRTWGGGKGAITPIGDLAMPYGTVSSGNSYVGTTASDGAAMAITTFDDFGNTNLANRPGHAVVANTAWNGNRGFITYINQDFGTLAPFGAISASNSLVGNTAGDRVGSGGVTLAHTTLAAGGSIPTVIAYSPNYSAGSIATAGAWSFLNGTIGSTGADFASLIGSATGEFSNSQLVSSNDAGWANGRAALVLPNFAGGRGRVLAINVADPGKAPIALDGAAVGDQLGSNGIQLLGTSGKFLVRSPLSGGGLGSITYLDLARTVATGLGNVLFGVSTLDHLGGTLTTVDQFSSGGLLVVNRANLGSITVVNDPSIMFAPISGTINSMVGSAVGDLAGATVQMDTTAFPYNQAFVRMPSWSSGAGAIYLAKNEANGVIGAGNSLVGTHAGDAIGSGGITNMYDRVYGVFSAGWNGGAGAITLFDARTGTLTGAVGSANSLVGSAAGDGVGSNPYDYVRFANRKLMFVTRSWGGGKGAVTLLQAPDTATGVVDASTSLVGTAAGDGSYNITPFDNQGGYSPTGATRALVSNAAFNGTRGMVTVVDSLLGSSPAGVISAANALVGSTAGDRVGSSVSLMYGQGVAITSPNWNGKRGAATFSAFGAFRTGAVSELNSLVGTSANDQVGIFGINSFTVGSGAGAYSGVVVNNPYFAGGKGAVTFVSQANPVGAVSVGNSVVGTVAGSGGFASIQAGADGDFMRVRFGTGSGRVVYVDPRATGPAPYAGGYGFADAAADGVTITPQTITAMTNAGTNVTLQANNDILVNAAITSAAGSGVSAPGGLKLEAGRSLLVNANIDMGGGNLALIANSQLANAAFRDSGVARLATGAGVTLASTGGFIGALMDSGTGGLGGSIELGNVNAAALEVRNWSTTSGSGIQQTAGSSWQTSALRMETRATNGAIGTLANPISFGASWLAARSTGGPMDLQGTASALTVSDAIPGGGSGGGVGNGDTRTFDNFYGLTTAGVGSVALRTAGDLSILANTQAVSVSAQNLALQAKSITVQALSAPVTVAARGAMELRTSGDISVQGGTAVDAYASVASAKNAFIVAGGRLGLKGGAGKGAFALIDPTDTGSGMSVSVTSVNIQGGTGDGAYGALVSTGGALALTASSVTLTAGTGADADAVILSPNARELLASYTGTCVGCLDLGGTNPLADGKTQAGFGVINFAGTPQQVQSNVMTLQSASLLDTFEALWNQEQTQAKSSAPKKKASTDGQVVVDEATCK